ncbi:MAG: DUF4363 family protein [Bacillota bacterium]|nr:DUF4363 family protein [Bacillota bacterium]
MKRIWIVLIMLFAVIGLCCYEFIFSNSLIVQTENKLSEANNAAQENNINKAYSICEGIYNNWRNHQKTMNIFYYHDSVENVGQSIALMSEYAKYKDYVHFYAENKKIGEQLSVLKSAELPSIDNIL